jgi:superfamily II DNA helicase RecQ
VFPAFWLCESVSLVPGCFLQCADCRCPHCVRLPSLADQVDALVDSGVEAAGLTSNLGADEASALLRDLFTISPKVKVLYVTPEKIKCSDALNNAFQKLYDNGKLNLFVIDEAHCVSQWGHDFRPDYLNLKVLKQTFPRTPLMALTVRMRFSAVIADSVLGTLRRLCVIAGLCKLVVSLLGNCLCALWLQATADDKVVTHIKQNLCMESGCPTFRRSFNRENLIYNVVKKESKDKTLDAIATFVKAHKNESGIIYCTSRKDTEMVTEGLRDRLKGTPLAQHVNFYHAGLDDPELRRRRHLDWQHDVCRVIVATVAFGMGIDKPDVRYVIHYSLPKSLVHYYQESGRAGRDGLQSICMLFYSFTDKRKVDWLIEKSENQDSIHRQKRALGQVVQFCENDCECRRYQLLRHFGEKFSPPQCKQTCDNCQNNFGYEANQWNCEREVRAILDSINSIPFGQNYTLAHCVQVFRGSTLKKIKDSRHDRLPMFGVGKTFPASLCFRLFHEMVVHQYLHEQDVTNKFSGFVSTYLRTGPCANKWLNGRRDDSFKLQIRGSKRKHLQVAPTQAAARSEDGFNIRLPWEVFENLKSHVNSFRAGLATRDKKAAFLVLQNTAVRQIIVRLPRTEEELREIDGVSRSKSAVAKEIMDEVWRWLRDDVRVVPSGTCSVFAGL